jgi:flagellar hook capping protein FlgD
VNLLGSEPVLKAPSKITVEPGQPVEIVVTANDPGGEPIHSLVADLSELPMLSNAVFTADPGNERGVLRWTPQPEDGGWTYNVPFTATSVLDKTRVTEIEVGTGTPIAFPPDGSFEQGIGAWNGYEGAILARVQPGRLGAWAVSAHQNGRTPEYGLNDHPNWIVTTPAAGATYRFSAWVRAPLGTGRARVRIREFLGAAKVGASTYSADVELSSTWHQVAVDHVAGGAGSTLDFQVLCIPAADNTTFQIDDVAIRTLGATPGSALGSAGSPTADHALTFERPTVFPNPFRTRAMLGFTLAKPGPLRIALFDLGGRRVRTVFEGAKAELGTHKFELDGADDHGHRLGAGVYFYRVESAEGVRQGRFVVLE